MNKKVIPYIESSTTWIWYCPATNPEHTSGVCGEYNEVEMDGDGFETPLVCDGCRAKFEEYESNL